MCAASSGVAKLNVLIINVLFYVILHHLWRFVLTENHEETNFIITSLLFKLRYAFLKQIQKKKTQCLQKPRMASRAQTSQDGEREKYRNIADRFIYICILYPYINIFEK